MSEIKVNSIKGVGASAAAITVNNTDGTCTANITNNLSNRNLVVNGDMRIAQRSQSSTTLGLVTIDRFATGGTGMDELPTYAQVDVESNVTPYTLGFRKAAKLTNGNQTSGAGSGDVFKFVTRLEAQSIATSGWNYKSASSFITLSYWVRSSVAQTFFVRVTALDSPVYNFPFSYAVSANTWTKVTKTIPGNSNLNFDFNNNVGLDVEWTLFRGTDTTGSGATLDTWAAYDSSQRQPDNTSTWYTTNDATWELTGVQLEVSDHATDFEHLTFADELRRCQRYFVKTDFTSHCTAYFGGSHLFRQIQFVCPTPMRAQPSFSVDGQESGGGTKFTIKTWSSDQNNSTNSAVHLHHVDYVHGTDNGAIYSVGVGIDFVAGNSGVPPNGPGNHNIYACRLYGATFSAEI